MDIHNEENEKVMGMVHISEISRSFVNEIRDFVTEGQVVRVKVIGINEQGKISLSMKQAEPEQKNNNRPESRSGQQRPRQHREKPNVWEPKKKPPVTELTFEDMLSRFKQNSEERMCDIKRNTERKNRTRRKLLQPTGYMQKKKCDGKFATAFFCCLFGSCRKQHASSFVIDFK